jgi:hypothetical protein
MPRSAPIAHLTHEVHTLRQRRRAGSPPTRPRRRVRSAALAAFRTRHLPFTSHLLLSSSVLLYDYSSKDT